MTSEPLSYATPLPSCLKTIFVVHREPSGSRKGPALFPFSWSPHAFILTDQIKHSPQWTAHRELTGASWACFICTSTFCDGSGAEVEGCGQGKTGKGFFQENDGESGGDKKKKGGILAYENDCVWVDRGHLLPNSALSNVTLVSEIGHHGSIYTTELGKHYRRGFLCFVFLFTSASLGNRPVPKTQCP